jgi:hypothetical protein
LDLLFRFDKTLYFFISSIVIFISLQRTLWLLTKADFVEVEASVTLESPPPFAAKEEADEVPVALPLDPMIGGAFGTRGVVSVAVETHST